MSRDWSQETFLTVQEVADELRLNPQTIRNWLDEGKLPALRVGRRVRILRSDLDRLLADSYSGRPDPPPAAEPRVDPPHL